MKMIQIALLLLYYARRIHRHCAIYCMVMELKLNTKFNLDNAIYFRRLTTHPSRQTLPYWLAHTHTQTSKLNRRKI